MNHYYERPSIKRDCVNYESTGCRALDKTYCGIGDCKFYKNPKMLHEQVKRIRERIPNYGAMNYEYLG